MLNGNMCCGVESDRIMLRVGPEQYDSTLARDGARPMDFTGRPMTGMVYVDPEHAATGKALAGWVDIAVAFAEALPAKKAKNKAKTGARRNAKA